MQDFMQTALKLARQNQGATGVNPSVGCVIVKDQKIIASAATAPGGRPHAEKLALEQAGENAKDATMFVTLEPCAHEGKTPPCVDGVISAGIKKIVVAMQDPDPRTAGKSLQKMADAGMEVELGQGGDEAEELYAGFTTRIKTGRPLVTLKLATSLDGKIATHTGQSQWITSQQSRDDAHKLRGQHNAIMVGSGTVMADDPMLTCRATNMENHCPLRIVMDGRLRIDLTSNLIQTARDIPTLIFTLEDTDKTRRQAIKDLGVEIVPLPHDADSVLDIKKALLYLGKKNINDLLVEGGANLAASLARHNLIDRLVWYRAPILLGGDGIPALKPFGVDELSQSLKFEHQTTTHIGGDIKEIYWRNAG